MNQLVSIRGLTVQYGGRGRSRRGSLRAVNDVSLTIDHGQVVGLIGESGSGKSSLARALVGFERPSRGHVLVKGVDLINLTGARLRAARAPLQMVFQNPDAALSQRQTVRQALGEALQIFGVRGQGVQQARTAELLGLVGLDASIEGRYPYELSGGQSQRVVIARALALEPELLVCDEPVSALDVSVQAQVMNVFEGLKGTGLALLFIAHDLAVVRRIADRVAVMYLGRIVEQAGAADLYRRPLHPYTQALLSAVPDPNPLSHRNHKRIILSGETPDPTDPPSGCPFRTRCRYAQDRCATEVPRLRLAGADQLHEVACHFVEQIAMTGTVP